MGHIFKGLELIFDIAFGSIFSIVADQMLLASPTMLNSAAARNLLNAKKDFGDMHATVHWLFCDDWE